MPTPEPEVPSSGYVRNCKIKKGESKMASKQEIRYIQYYVGSAAPKLIPQQPKKKKSALPKEYKQQSYTIRVDPLALGGIVVSAVMLVLMLVGLVQLHSAKQELAQMASYVETLQETNNERKVTFAEKCDLDAVEKAALEMGMIPMEEAQRMTISVPQEEVRQTTFWDRVGVFLDGLLA